MPDPLLALLHPDTRARTRECVPVSALLREARDHVRDAACARAIRIVVVGVDDAVFVRRTPIVSIVAALLADAVDAAPPGGRVAVTGQPIEHELVFAVFDERRGAHRSGALVAEAARKLGGRVWSVDAGAGNLSLFALPLHDDEN